MNMRNGNDYFVNEKLTKRHSNLRNTLLPMRLKREVRSICKARYTERNKCWISSLQKRNWKTRKHERRKRLKSDADRSIDFWQKSWFSFLSHDEPRLIMNIDKMKRRIMMLRSFGVTICAKLNGLAI